MNQLFKNLVLCLLLLSNAAFTSDDTKVRIDFENPEKFTDFKTQINLRIKDREMLMKQLTKLMVKSVDKHISKGRKMNVTINNIDMAGTFLNKNSDLYRVVRDSDRVLINFSYKLFDTNGQLIKKEDVNLSSRHNKFRKRVAKKYQHTHFANEMPLFDKWLKTL